MPLSRRLINEVFLNGIVATARELVRLRHATTIARLFLQNDFRFFENGDCRVQEAKAPRRVFEKKGSETKPAAALR